VGSGQRRADTTGGWQWKNSRLTGGIRPKNLVLEIEFKTELRLFRSKSGILSLNILKQNTGKNGLKWGTTFIIGTFPDSK
jgi:hypothetical protein